MRVQCQRRVLSKSSFFGLSFRTSALRSLHSHTCFIQQYEAAGMRSSSSDSTKVPHGASLTVFLSALGRSKETQVHLWHSSCFGKGLAGGTSRAVSALPSRVELCGSAAAGAACPVCGAWQCGETQSASSQQLPHCQAQLLWQAGTAGAPLACCTACCTVYPVAI